MKQHLALRRLCEGAVLLAMAQILSLLRLYRFPDGGSIDAAMLPLVVFAVRWGPLPGLGAGFVCGILQYFTGNGLSISWISLIGDYLLSYATLFAAGFFRGRKNGVIYAALVFGLARLLVHWVVGAVVWGQYMPDTFFGLTMTGPWLYSALYNGAYMLPCTLVTTLLAAILNGTLKKYFSDDLKRE